MLGTVSVLLRGIPFIYQGQEIGMRNVRRTSIEEFDDISTKDQYAEALAAGLSEQEALAACNRLSRDNARTPMQWSSGKEAGFTEGTPWLAVNPDYQKVNVEAQEKEPGFYPSLLPEADGSSEKSCLQRYVCVWLPETGV